MRRNGRTGRVLGRDVGPFGRGFRLVFGALALAGVGGDLLRDHPSAAGLGPGVLVALLGYAALYRLWATRTLQRSNPWIGSVIVVAPSWPR